MAKKLFHVSMIVPDTALYELTTVAEGRAFNLQINPVKDTASTGAVTPNGRVKVRDVLAPWIAGQETFTAKDAIEQGRSSGLKAGAVYSELKRMQEEKAIKRLTPGSYRTLAKAKNGHAASKKTVGKWPTTHRDFILGQIKKGHNTYKQLMADFEATGRPRRSVDGAVGVLKEKNLITTQKHGVYELTAKGKENV